MKTVKCDKCESVDFCNTVRNTINNDNKTKTFSNIILYSKKV